MKPDVIRRFAAAILLALAFQTAWAIDIHAAKEQGLVGEANTGYLAPIGTPSAEVKALVNMVMNINTAGLAEGLGLADAGPGDAHQRTVCDYCRSKLCPAEETPLRRSHLLEPGHVHPVYGLYGARLPRH